MENEQLQTENNKKNRSIKIAVIAILLLLPIIFLLIKFSKSGPAATENTANSVAPVIDIASYENAVNTNPNYDNYISLSNAYVNSNLPGKSVAPLLKALELNPKSAIAYNNLGVAYTMLQQYNKGIEACNKALEIDSSFQLAKNNLNWATSEKKNVLAFIEKQTQAADSSRNATFYINLGLAYMKLSDYDKSIESWNKIFQYDPKSIVAYNNIGTAFMMKDQVDDAAAMFKKAVESDPNDQLSKNNLAWAMAESAKKKQ